MTYKVQRRVIIVDYEKSRIEEWTEDIQKCLAEDQLGVWMFKEVTAMKRETVQKISGNNKKNLCSFFSFVKGR
jgi:hypothetical protein